MGICGGVSQPRPELGFAPMRTILRPAEASVSAARHIVWYLNFQISGRQVR
jgi:hypothetical protein